MDIRISGIDQGSIVDGPGIRVVIYTQGCSHHCPGCHNPETWDPDGGYIVKTEEIAEIIRKLQWCHSITFSGGDPLEQPMPVLDIIRRLKGFDPSYHFMLYTGYTWEEIMNPNNILSADVHARRSVIRELDLLVDGRFEIEKKSLNLEFRGSSNQRIIDVKQSLLFNEVVCKF